MTLIWKADLNQANSTLAGFNSSGSQRQNGAGTFNDTTVPWPMIPVGSPGGRPENSLKFTIPNNYRRYEANPEHMTFNNGDSYYFGNAVYFGSDFPLSTPPDYQIFEQIHQAWGSWSPPIAFEAMNNSLYLTGGNGLIRSVDAGAPTNTWAHSQVLMPLELQTWYNYVYYVENFSNQPATTKVSMWVNGVQVLNAYTLPCPSIVQGDASTDDSYRKIGFYHRETIPGGTVYHSGTSLATSLVEADPTPPEPAPNRLTIGSSFFLS
jgi:hypothetical protein